MSDEAAPRPLDLTRAAASHLASKGVDDARLDAELLLAHVLGLRRLDLYLQFERPLAPEEVQAYRHVVRRRARREPLQYITGTVQFRELELVVDPRVLIPRPETEILVGEVLTWARSRFGLTALDIGTGSGAIALSLLREGDFERVVATDSSPEAVAAAAENARRTGLADRLELRAGALWEPIGDAERFDVIVSNPPYVGEDERAGLMPEVREYEPAAALIAGDSGLGVIRAIVARAGSYLRPGGLLALELGLGQADAVAGMMQEARLGAVRVARDLTGRERILLCERT